MSDRTEGRRWPARCTPAHPSRATPAPSPAAVTAPDDGETFRLARADLAALDVTEAGDPVGEASDLRAWRQRSAWRASERVRLEGVVRGAQSRLLAGGTHTDPSTGDLS